MSTAVSKINGISTHLLKKVNNNLLRELKSLDSEDMGIFKLATTQTTAITNGFVIGGTQSSLMYAFLLNSNVISDMTLLSNGIDWDLSSKTGISDIYMLKANKLNITYIFCIGDPNQGSAFPILTLDTSGMINLTNLIIPFQSNLSGIDLTDNINLTELKYYSSKAVSSLDLTNNVNLVTLDLLSTIITTLILPTTTNNLVTLKASCNITTWDLSITKMPLLQTLSLDNQSIITSLTTLNNTSLISIDIRSLTQTTIDFSSNTSVTGLTLFNLTVTTLTLPTNTVLSYLYIRGSSQTNNLNLVPYNLLSFLYLQDIPNITTLDLSSNTTLTKLTLINLTSVTVLSLINNVNLTSILINNVPFTTIDLSANNLATSIEITQMTLTSITLPTTKTNLTSLILTRPLYGPVENIGAISVVGYTNLVTYQVKGSFTSIDLSTNTLLQTLVVSNDSLTAIDVTPLTALTTLRLRTNNASITTINISNQTLLKYFELFNNYITSITIPNAGIEYINIHNTALTTLVLPTTLNNLLKLEVPACLALNTDANFISNISKTINCQYYHVGGCSFSATQLDNFLINIDTNNLVTVNTIEDYKYLRLNEFMHIYMNNQIGAATRTSASDTAHASLITKGWIIDVV